MTVTAEPAMGPDGGPAWEPRGHPVRWAIGVVTLLVAVSLTSIVFGALTPRIDVDLLGWGDEPGTSDEVYAVIELTNDADAAARLVSAGESLPGLELVAVEVGPAGDEVVAGAVAPLDAAERLDDAVTIGPHETVAVELRYRVTDCARVPRDPPSIPLELRTILGLTRTSRLDTLDTDKSGAPLPWTSSLLARRC